MPKRSHNITQLVVCSYAWVFPAFVTMHTLEHLLSPSSGSLTFLFTSVNHYNSIPPCIRKRLRNLAVATQLLSIIWVLNAEPLTTRHKPYRDCKASSAGSSHSKGQGIRILSPQFFMSFSDAWRRLACPSPPNSFPSLSLLNRPQFPAVFFTVGWPRVHPPLPGSVCAWARLPRVGVKSSPSHSKVFWLERSKIIHFQGTSSSWSFPSNVYIRLGLQHGCCYLEIGLFGIRLLWQVDDWEKMQSHLLSSAEITKGLRSISR